MVEGCCRRAVLDRCALLLEARQLPYQILDEQPGKVVAEAAPDDDSQSREILAVLRERVGRHLPAALAQRVRDVEHGEVLDLVS